MKIQPVNDLGLDIGGANIKAAQGGGVARVVPFELWKRPEDLPEILRGVVAALPEARRVAVATTAELCDCFATKAAGVAAVMDAVGAVFPGGIVRVWGTDDQFHPIDTIRRQPDLAAAANWLALAEVAARQLPEGPGLLVDVGSTTTDLIPLLDGRPVPRGRTDTQRLRTGELVYAGVVRTPLCALAAELPWRGGPIGLAAELFASTLDVYLTLGEIPPDPRDDSTADGRPRTVEAARDRLARMVGADRDGFSAADAGELARAADESLMTRLVAAAGRACGEIGPPRGVVVCGSGEFLAGRLAARLVGPGGRVVHLRDAWGPAASDAGCAHALSVLAGERAEAWS